ncbi:MULTISPECIES: PfkB family carbohydrate kinase [unclassified Undibacterium]|uniref:PfkB family carbohydrate kinase n=1 Tax=unclassified Undibacterium TaxID=2630295 RepID=UPI002AC90DB2|nr:MULTISPECIES: PfkB family carbohydrate kinase [unclassified Undibacterium]MEB0140191.1 PfkB family carbohydrate kinase [Undibacterium sp. CCC2.1]MEB0172435.1 PfkB family carbohydrate kinase [Undibacterium sp. CCC1.1]MEB0176953.1 PfkB family carbohydrate kinase [Undibacterium sp. CCC3.4]MEB0215557.1 PfkB family carbohydrate kinase [Undibacterium sp. 5I2]WPX43736.1 PfkB family carbohydrate kinase [Undibacterium sp. CCC3.4]
MIVTFGEALVDMIEQEDGRFAAILGGSVCNFTLAVARQGMAVTYLNPFSIDTFGDRFTHHLRGAGVSLASPTRSLQPTSIAVVTLNEQKLPTYAFHRAAVADRDITAEQACAALPSAMTLLHTGGLTLVPDEIEKTLQIVRAAGKAGAIISIDANMRPMVCPDLTAYAAGVRKMLALADMVKVSDEDLRHLGLQHAEPIDAARTLFLDSNIKLIALTLGEHGGILLSRTEHVAQGIPAGVSVVDTVGAGDSFWAGLAASLQGAGHLSVAGLSTLNQTALENALRFAIATASLNVMRAGCNPPDSAEVAAFLAR